MIFVELCHDEFKKGNRPGSHFNKVGWLNIVKKLKEKTGRDYTKLQLKNHWDAMKRDWKIYDRLMRIESGLGWDPVKKTIDATPEWWDDKIKADPEIAKFRGKNVEMYYLHYDPLFKDSVAVGDKTMTPDQFQNDNGSYDVENIPNPSINVEGKGDSDDVSSDGVEQIKFPESSSTKRKKSLSAKSSRSSTGKSTAASTFEVKLDTVLQALSSKSTQIFSPSAVIPSIKDCIDIVATSPDFQPGSNAYNKALRIFLDKNIREAFMCPPTDYDKILFLYSLMD